MALIGSRTSTIYDTVEKTDVFDTHTHLDESRTVAAETPWDILHYFWFRRELSAAGYPEAPEQLDERTRRLCFLDAFEKSRNTSWNQIVRRILSDLYSQTLETPADFDALSEKMSVTAADPQWPAHVCDRLAVRHIVVDERQMRVASSFGERLVVVPSYNLSRRIRLDGAATAEVEADIDALTAKECRTIRVELDPYLTGASLPATEEALWERLLERLNETGTRVQVFTGMKRDRTPHTMLNDPQRIVRLYPLFDRFRRITFEMINAAAGNNLDIVQAARVFPNVDPGGLWWFNFRISTYREVLQQRFEALPTRRASIVASDARCVEWLYGKVLLIKSVLAQFLDEQIASGWTNLDGARQAAHDWLYTTAKAGYTGAVGELSG